MFKFLATIAASLSLIASAAPAPKSSLPIVLTPNNTLTLFGDVNEDMVENVATSLPRIQGNTIYVNIVSGGGSVQSGKRIIEQLTAAVQSGKQVICIPHMAISMAFVILQSSGCPTRMAVPASVLMQHQPSLVIQGPIRNVQSLFDSVKVELNEIERMQAARLKMTHRQFIDITAFDWWLNSGTIAAQHNAVDSVGTVLCSTALIKRKKVREVQFFFRTLIIESSECPYILRQKVIIPEKKQADVRVDVQF